MVDLGGGEQQQRDAAAADQCGGFSRPDWPRPQGERVRAPRRVVRRAGDHVDDTPALGALDTAPAADSPAAWGDVAGAVDGADSDLTARLLREKPPHWS
ncbi:MAG: hypothetical protein Q4C71_02345 [Microbacteriaceae bacterium]|nr:hypothetical protein [Microbacteriaceae bacterium]